MRKDFVKLLDSIYNRSLLPLASGEMPKGKGGGTSGGGRQGEPTTLRVSREPYERDVHEN